MSPVLWQDTGFPQSRDALQDLGCSIQEFRKFLAHKIVHYNCQPENHDERMNLINVHIGFIRPPQSFFICKDAVMPRTCRQRCQKSDYSYHSLDRIDIVKEEIGIVKPLITSAMGKV